MGRGGRQRTLSKQRGFLYKVESQRPRLKRGGMLGESSRGVPVPAGGGVWTAPLKGAVFGAKEYEAGPA